MRETNSDAEPWPEPANPAERFDESARLQKGNEMFDEFSAVLQKGTGFNEHEIATAAAYVTTTWIPGPERYIWALCFREAYSYIEENPVVQQLVYPNYRIGRS